MLDDILNNDNYVGSNCSDNIKVVDEYYKQISFDDLISVTRISGLLIEKVNSINIDKLYDSKIHGVNHAIRVAILVNYIAKSYGIDDEQLELLIDCAIYHDMGRICDIEDKDHGYRSSILIGKIIKNKDLEYMNSLKAIITAHAYDDSYDEFILSYYDNLFDNINFLLAIFKDADALDRVRTDDLDSSYLRCDISKRLIKASSSLYINMKRD